MDKKCILCGKICSKPPTICGWFTIQVNERIEGVHNDCADWLKELSDQIRNAHIAHAKECE